MRSAYNAPKIEFVLPIVAKKACIQLPQSTISSWKYKKDMSQAGTCLQSQEGPTQGDSFGMTIYEWYSRAPIDSSHA